MKSQKDYIAHGLFRDCSEWDKQLTVPKHVATDMTFVAHVYKIKQ